MVAVFAFVSMETAAGVVLVLIHTRPVNTHVGHTLVPIWNTDTGALPTMHCDEKRSVSGVMLSAKRQPKKLKPNR